MMTELETDLLGALLRLQQAAIPSANPGRRNELMEAISDVDRMTLQMPKKSDPTLLHYLHKKSYEKAILFLKGRDSENAGGNCGHMDL